MASEKTIIRQIEKTVGVNYSDWKIGITNDPAQRKAALGNLLNWLQWQADSHQEAQNVFRYFVQKGMKRSGVANKAATNVYIFLV
ncbi:MAG TPA: hypothetical protein VGA99_10835 [bacterium]